MAEFLRSRITSIGYAISGWWYVIHTQRNAWIHALASVVVLALSFWLQLGRIEWIFILIAIAFVWTAEFFNTALEVIVDLATREHHPLAKVSKDVGAAAVLIAALTAALIGVLVLGPPLLSRLIRLFSAV